MIEVDGKTARSLEGRAGPARLIKMLRDRAVAAHGLTPRVGRLEELESQERPELGLSISYGCWSIRVRMMQGRRWVSYFDLPANHLRPDHIARFMSACRLHFEEGA